MSIKSAERRIRWARNAAIISSIIGVLAAVRNPSAAPPSAVALTTAITLGLATGIHLRSRIACISMVLLFTASAYFTWSPVVRDLDFMLRSWSGVLSAIVFFVLYVEGLRGAIAWHQLVRATETGK